jgi:hypothetical protein
VYDGKSYSYDEMQYKPIIYEGDYDEDKESNYDQYNNNENNYNDNKYHHSKDTNINDNYAYSNTDKNAQYGNNYNNYNKDVNGNEKIEFIQNVLECLFKPPIIYVVWRDNTPGNFDIFFSRSTDNGGTFSQPDNISENTCSSVSHR